MSKDTGTIHLCVLLLSLSQAARESENEKKNLFAPQRKSVDWKWATATAAIFFFSHWCIWLKSEACKIHGLFPLPFSIFSTQENFLMCQFCICCQLPFKMSEKKGELFKVQIRSVEVKRVCHANGPKRTWCMHSRKKGCQKRDLVFHIFVSFDQIALLKMPFFGCKRPYDYRVQTPQPPKS